MSPPADGALVGAIMSKSSTIGCRVVQKGIVICDATWPTDIPTLVKKDTGKGRCQGGERVSHFIYTELGHTPLKERGDDSLSGRG